MSPAARDEMDRIRAQVYWDWRDTLRFFRIVGEKMPWSPPPKT
jgi:hypothetical protein